MNAAATIDRLIDLARARFPAAPAELGPDDDFYAVLGINSIEALELLSEVELAFDVEIPDYELQEVKTFTQLAAKIGERQP